LFHSIIPTCSTASKTPSPSTARKRMICLKETLAAQTIQKAAKPLETPGRGPLPMEVAGALLPKAHTLQPRQARDGQVARVTHACIFQPRKKPQGPTSRSPRLRQFSDRHKARRGFRRCLCRPCDTLAVTSRHSKRAPTAVQGRLQVQSGRTFALRIAETFASLSTCRPLPLSRI
jgi:hypothetical protein